MPRPRKRRRLARAPQPVTYKPVGAPLRAIESTVLLHEELESLRLADAEGRYQAEAAEQMSVSRSTFQRLVTEARRKVASALVSGNALLIQGGTFSVGAARWHCTACGHNWETEPGSGQGETACPACGSHAIRERAGRRQRRRR